MSTTTTGEMIVQLGCVCVIVPNLAELLTELVSLTERLVQKKPRSEYFDFACGQARRNLVELRECASEIWMDFQNEERGRTVSMYSCRKAMRLCRKCESDVLSLLFLKRKEQKALREALNKIERAVSVVLCSSPLK